jgi:hypothetical protein
MGWKQDVDWNMTFVEHTEENDILFESRSVVDDQVFRGREFSRSWLSIRGIDLGVSVK